MDLKTAYGTLGLNDGASKDDAKKAFRKLAAQYHPDKQDGNEAKFKEVNEAYQLIDTGRDFGPTARQPSSHGYAAADVIDIEDLIRQAHGGSPFNRRQRQTRAIHERHANITISFKESILGCQKQISFKRAIKCIPCNGNGMRQVDSGCKVCHGTGFLHSIRGNFTMRAACHACQGLQKLEKCAECQETGVREADVVVSVNIPAGVSDERNTLTLRGMGDYVGSGFGMDQWMDAYLHVTIEPQKSLKLIGNDVVTECDITLLQALEGCKITIDTIDGVKDVDLDPGIKNGNEVQLSKLGVDRKGVERVIVNVHYPQSFTSLIDVLKQNKEP